MVELANQHQMSQNGIIDRCLAVRLPMANLYQSSATSSSVQMFTMNVMELANQHQVSQDGIVNKCLAVWLPMAIIVY
jgi:hypothetical protein